MVVTIGAGLHTYAGVDAGFASVQGGTSSSPIAFHAYQKDNIDMIQNSVRVVGSTGRLEAYGRLEVRTPAGFGTIAGMDQGAADVACASLGYSKGIVSKSSCRSLGLCAGASTPVALRELSCKGFEGDIMACEWSASKNAAQGHDSDSVVLCGDRKPAEGDAHLVGIASAVSSIQEPLVTRGRLEIYRGGSWGGVCARGFSATSDAAVACRGMGFEGVDSSSTAQTCAQSEGGFDMCSSRSPVLQMKSGCSGNEANLLECSTESLPHTLCSAQDAVMVACTGYASSSLSTQPAANSPKLPWRKRMQLKCSTTLEETRVGNRPPGTSALFQCPSTCVADSNSGREGAYPESFSVCKAAAVEGVLGRSGGLAVVTVGWPQSSSTSRSFMVSEAVGVHNEEASHHDVKIFSTAGDSSFGNGFLQRPAALS